MIDNEKVKSMAAALSWEDGEEKVKAIIRTVAIRREDDVDEYAAEIEDLAAILGEKIEEHATLGDATLPENLLDRTSHFVAEVTAQVAEEFDVDEVTVSTIVNAFSSEMKAEAKRLEETTDAIADVLMGALNPAVGGEYECRRFYHHGEGMDVFVVRPGVTDLSGFEGVEPGATGMNPIKNFEASTAIKGLEGILDSIEVFGCATEEDDDPLFYVEAHLDGSPLVIQVYFDNPWKDYNLVDPYSAIVTLGYRDYAGADEENDEEEQDDTRTT